MAKIKKRWVWHEGGIADPVTGTAYYEPDPDNVGGKAPGSPGCQGRWKTSDFGTQVCPHCGEMCRPRVHWDGNVVGG